LRDRIDLVVLEEQRKAGGLSLSVAISLLLHAALVLWFARAYRPVAKVAADVPIARYVELMKQNPQTFTEAPGTKVDRAPIDAPLSDANRRAAIPEPTGDQPTTRPGDGRGLYTPPSGDGRPPAPRPQPQVAPQQEQRGGQSALSDGSELTQPADGMVYRQPSNRGGETGTPVDWKAAIREAARQSVAAGGSGGIDLGGAGGGEKGYAEAGPLSFETQWYDWGEYAASMVGRIRVNWYANMPQIIRTGMQGVVTIRFTIHRDGRISDVEILKSSGVPPYDFAARKAIELSSPLNALPKDFPNPTERVTAMFFYNMEIPR
jgi:TonB family protein